MSWMRTLSWIRMNWMPMIKSWILTMKNWILMNFETKILRMTQSLIQMKMNFLMTSLNFLTIGCLKQSLMKYKNSGKIPMMMTQMKSLTVSWTRQKT